MRRVNLNNLPRKKWNNTTVIDWINIKNEKCEFEYDGVTGVIDISFSEKRGNSYRMKLQYKNKEKEYPHEIIKQGKIGSLVKPSISGRGNNIVTELNWLYGRKDIWKYFDDLEILKKYSYGSSKFLGFKCPSCQRIYNKRISDVCRFGFSCRLCNGKSSFNERLVENLLTENNIKYTTQKYWKECKKTNPLPFDFYLPEYNMVIETHGEQHYKEIGFFNHKNTIESDKIKKEFCQKNNIIYIEIDCSSRDGFLILNQIKNKTGISSINNHKIVFKSLHGNFDDFNKIEKMYLDGYSFNEIKKELGKYTEEKIKNILISKGVYDSDRRYQSNSRKIVDIHNGKIYNNIYDASLETNKKESSIRVGIGKYATYNDKGDIYFFVKNEDLKLRKNKEHLKKIRDRSLNIHKENYKNKNIEKIELKILKDGYLNIESFLLENDYDIDLMMQLDNLKGYVNKNGNIYKK